MRSPLAVTAATDEKAKVEDAKHKPVFDAQNDELSEIALEKVVGGTGPSTERKSGGQ
jgi:hypothetical protein